MFILSLLLAMPVLQAVSYTAILERCTEQNLEPEQGEVRNRWARKCFRDQIEYIDFFSSRKPVKYALVWSPSTNSWQGPIHENAPCGDWIIKSFCVASCYTPDQQILFESGFLAIGEALERNETYLMVLKKGSSLEKPAFEPMIVEAYTRSWQEGHETIRIIKTQSGGQLKITENHPILLASGEMIEARDLRVGDWLVKQNGQKDPVSSIENIDYFGKVFNVAPKSLNPTENILVAQGFLVGSGAYQYTEELHALIRSYDRRPINP